jgi:putative peptide zinc metalloprotease protein
MYIPELNGELEIEQIENDTCYFVHQASGDFRLRVNEQTRQLLLLINGQRNLQDLTYALNRQNKSAEISVQQVMKLIKETLQPCGIIKPGEEETLIRSRNTYLNLRMNLLPSNVVSHISFLFRSLINKHIWLVLGLLVFALTLFYSLGITTSGLKNFAEPLSLFYYILFSILSSLLHELGHATACKHFNIKPGAIGFGFYLISPVFYADVSNAWKLGHTKRIVINVAGMYFQLLLSMIMLVLYSLFKNEWLLYASFANTLATLPNLNPFVRYDGYWILSDSLGIPNLMEKAKNKFEDTWNWIKNRNRIFLLKPLQNKTDVFLFLYFFASRISILLFLLSAIFLSKYPVLDFPSRVLNVISESIIKNTFPGFDFFRKFLFDNVLSILFWFFLFRWLKKLIIKNKEAGHSTVYKPA